MKKLALYTLLSGALLFSGCATEEDITPNIDTTPEYEELLKVTESSSEIDKTIYEWYQKYNTAFLYKFEDNDFSWLWTSKFNRTYVKFDPSNEEDMAMLEKQLNYIKTKLLDMYDEETLKNALPYKVFLVKELRSTANATSSLSSTWVLAVSNGQDAMMIGYLKKTSPFTASNFETELGSVFGGFFFNKMPIKPTKFMETRPVLTAKLVTLPKDAQMKADLKVKPDFENENHDANVCGYIIGYLPTHVQEPTEAQDYADYLTFLTKRPGSEIRKITNFYWRVAYRATLFMEFYKEAFGEDLIATQNAAFPDDKVTLEDFNYDH